jgi:DNA-binding FadR family transcriptional regulator
MHPLALRPARLADPVIFDLCDAIVGGRLRRGDSLPTEPELCDIYSVSRTVIREAVQSLQERGLVQVKQGQKTTVLSADQWNLLDPTVLEATVRHDADLAILDDLVEVRVALEEQMAARAARIGTAEDFLQLKKMLADMDNERGNPSAYWALDAAFHDTFMIASGNRLARVVVKAIYEKARASTRYNGSPDSRDLHLGHEGHIEICDLITRRKPDQAARAVRKHIVTSWNRRKQERPDRTNQGGANVESRFYGAFTEVAHT